MRISLFIVLLQNIKGPVHSNRLSCMLKPDIAVYRLVSRQTKAAKVSPMKGSFTSAFVLFIRREYTIHASSKKQKPYPKGKAKRRE
jgi:hypothetical protein